MRYTKPTISFDVDDVLADFNTKWYRFAQETHPHYKLEKPVGWNAPNWPLTDTERTILNMAWMGVPNFYADLESLPGVTPEVFRKLQQRAHVIFVTSRHHHPETPAYKQTVEWVRLWLEIQNPVVVVTEDKPSVLRAARALCHVDDRPDTLARLPLEARLPSDMEYRSTIGILMRAPANADLQSWGLGSLAETFGDAIDKVEIVLKHWETIHGLFAR